MIGDKSKFTSLKKLNGGSVKFNNNNTTRICGKGSLSIDGKYRIDDVLYFKGLKYNLLSVSQMCDKVYNITFYAHVCEIKKNGKIVEKSIKSKGNCTISLNSKE